MKTITRLARLVLKLHHIPPSATLIPKHVSNLIVSCAEFQARPPICSSPCSWEPLLCSSLTKISLPTKKNKQQVQNDECWSSFLLSILSELRYLRTHLWRYLRVLRFQLTLSQSTAKMCAHASICAWTCENQSKNIYACLDLRKSLHKCLFKKIRLLQFAL